jgi:1-phosphatidylinositol-4-phosphate 5-kinase
LLFLSIEVSLPPNPSKQENKRSMSENGADIEDHFDSKLNLQVTRQSVRVSDDPTMLEIQRLPKLRPSLTTRLSTKFSTAGKAMHIFKDRKKKRVDENHKHFLTAHCIRDGIRYTTKNMKDEEADKHTISDASFRLIKRTTLPVTTPYRDNDCEPSASLAFAPSVSSMGSSFNFAPSPDNESFEYKEYAPHVFLKLRKHWGISQQAYVESLASEELYLDFQSNSKSGQFFFFTNDKFFMIKTLTTQEGIWLQECLEAYYRHNLKYPDTMLVKIMGLYRTKVPRKRKRKMRKTHFVVMRSTFDTVLPMHKKFDLKGSHVGREASESDKKKLFPVLKDRDLENSGIQLKFGPDKDERLNQLQVDCELLTSLNLMDYSLLIGIFDKSRVDPAHGFDDGALREILRQDNCLHFTDRLEEHGVIYFLGIIDFLQHYNTNKKFETIAKSVVNNSREISSVKPRFYAERLVQFITKFVA